MDIETSTGDDGGHIEITDKVDADVFATVPGAYGWAALMGGKAGDSRPAQKHTYSVRFHNIGRYPQPAYSLSMQAWRHRQN